MRLVFGLTLGRKLWVSLSLSLTTTDLDVELRKEGPLACCKSRSDTSSELHNETNANEWTNNSAFHPNSDVLMHQCSSMECVLLLYKKNHIRCSLLGNAVTDGVDLRPERAVRISVEVLLLEKSHVFMLGTQDISDAMMQRCHVASRCGSELA